MSKRLYHCVDYRNDEGRLIALCSQKSEGYIRAPLHIFDYARHWIPNSTYSKYPEFWVNTTRCPECVAHEDYPLLVLASV